MERESLEAHLGALSSEELAGRADALRSLQSHPGWAVFCELIDVQREKAIGHLVHRPLSDAAAYAHGGGYVKALEQIPQIIGKVLATARAVERAVLNGDGGEPA